MGGTRHGRNCTNHAQFSYHERQRAKRDGKYGTRKARVGRDSLRAFDCCCITLKPCKQPVVSKQGYVFDREAILEYIVNRKATYQKQLKEWAKQKKMLDEALALKRESAHKDHVTKFLAEETSVTGSRAIFSAGQASAAAGAQSETGAVVAMIKSNEKSLPVYWMPKENAEPTMKPKPSKDIKCPVSSKPIKMKDMVHIEFTRIDDSANDQGKSANARYMCPLSRVTLTNATPCVVLRLSGKVIAAECVKEFIEKDMIDPFTNTKMTKDDLIKLASEGTGVGASAKMAEVETAVLTVG